MRRNILLVGELVSGFWCSALLSRAVHAPTPGGPTPGVTARGTATCPATGDHRPFLPVQRRRAAALPGGRAAGRTPGVRPRLDHAGLDLDAADRTHFPATTTSSPSTRAARATSSVAAGGYEPVRRGQDIAELIDAARAAAGGAGRLVAGRAGHAGLYPRRAATAGSPAWCWSTIRWARNRRRSPSAAPPRARRRPPLPRDVDDAQLRARHVPPAAAAGLSGPADRGRPAHAARPPAARCWPIRCRAPTGRRRSMPRDVPVLYVVRPRWAAQGGEPRCATARTPRCDVFTRCRPRAVRR